jgi:hypothetical protein
LIRVNIFAHIDDCFQKSFLGRIGAGFRVGMRLSRRADSLRREIALHELHFFAVGL